ncbi:MAG: type II/IV secretion system protein [Desulfobacterales bacterium]|nr:type II/IV secretion system protein [Desulfobacterales bacterium]
MTTEKQHPFADKAVCKTLVRHGLLTKEQARDVLEKKARIQGNLEKEKADQAQDGAASTSVRNPVTIVDVIASFKFKRADNPSLELDEDAIFNVLADEWGYPYKKIDPVKLDLNLVTTTIPRNFAMKHLVLPIGVESGRLVVATANPFNAEVIEDLGRVSQMPVTQVVTAKSDVIRLINEFFGFKRSIAAAEVQFGAPSIDLGNLEQYVRLKATDELPANDHHIVNAVNHLLSYAFDQRASDIHIEPKRDTDLVRMRIDGVLHTVYKLPKKVHSAIISRIKTLSRLDIAEKRRPQDGRIKTAKGDAEVEIRISTIPVAFGEKVVMRIMDPDILFQEVEELGFTSQDFEHYQRMFSMPYGLILVCGPTGSGKSTTLYSTLRRISTPDINITTVEDPIEMIHEEFNQIAVQPAANVTFATILRNILRQDPDVVMVGELRDLETVQNAIQTALTGHLVLSTLHTNDAPSAIIRLMDIGLPHFLIQATLTGVISQRLVRKICPKCMESFEMDCEQLRQMGLDLGRDGRVKLYRGKGCINCRYTGYYGRTSVFEVMPYTRTLREKTTATADLSVVQDQALREGMVTLRENAVKKLLDGVTTYQEVMRVTWEQA